MQYSIAGEKLFKFCSGELGTIVGFRASDGLLKMSRKMVTVALADVVDILTTSGNLL